MCTQADTQGAKSFLWLLRKYLGSNKLWSLLARVEILDPVFLGPLAVS